MGANKVYRELADLPGQLRIFPLSGCLLLPRVELPLNIFEPRYIDLIDAALAADRLIGMIQPSIEAAESLSPGLFPVGCAGRLTRFAETGDGRYIVTLEGVCRFRVIGELGTGELYRTVSADFTPFVDDLVADRGQEWVDRDAVFKALRAYTEKNSIPVDWNSIRDSSSEMLVNALSMMSPFGPAEKQALLEAPDLATRARILVTATEFELAGGGVTGSHLN